MEEHEKGFRALRERYNQNLANTLFQVMQAKGIKSGRIIENIRKTYGEDLNSGTISGYKNGKVQMSSIFIWEACKLIGISVDEVFQLAEKAMAQGTLAINRQYDDVDKMSTDQNLLLTLPASPLINTDPNIPVFKGYWGNYYIYFAPTYSSGKGFLKGTMCISRGVSDVHVKINLVEHIWDTESHHIDKIYEGVLVHSTAVKCCYCILSSSEVGEMCFFMFRHFHLNNRELECRLAEVLTASAGGEDKTPTTHRMLISRDMISDEDIFSLLPLLSLNNSQITISKPAMQQLVEKEPNYKKIIDYIMSLPSTESEEYYRIRENTIRSAIYGFENISLLSLILSLRRQAISPRYNKISKKADETLRTLLLEKDYFSPNNEP